MYKKKYFLTSPPIVFESCVSFEKKNTINLPPHLSPLSLNTFNPLLHTHTRPVSSVFIVLMLKFAGSDYKVFFPQNHIDLPLPPLPSNIPTCFLPHFNIKIDKISLIIKLLKLVPLTT